MRVIAKSESVELRHEVRPLGNRDGFAPTSELLTTKSMRGLYATKEDIREIARGGGGNRKLRCDIGPMGVRTPYPYEHLEYTPDHQGWQMAFYPSTKK